MTGDTGKSIASNEKPSLHAPGFLFFICYLGFVSLGLPDPLIGVAWPSVRKTFGLEQSEVSWIFIGSGCSYFLSSFFAGRLLKVFNVGVLLAGSSALVALSGFDYGFARVWPLFALGSLLHGLGSGAIDSSLNHYVASHFSARHMNWLHACYSLGAMLGPLLMTMMITHANSWRLGYLVVASILLTLSLLFFTTQSRWNDSGAPGASEPVVSQPTATVTTWSALRTHGVWLHIVLFFVYTGLEVALGQWSYTVLTESRGIQPDVAGIWVTIYWGSILAGRIAFGFVVDRMSIDLQIRFSTVAALAGTALLAWNPTTVVAPVALALAGLGLAVIFPCLMTRTPQRFGKEVAAHAIGFQVGAAMLGAAALPSLCGLIAQYVGLYYVPSTLFGLAVVLYALHEIVVRRTSNDFRSDTFVPNKAAKA